MRKRDGLRFYIILMLSIVTVIFILSKIFPYSDNLNNYYDDVSIEDTSKLALSSNNKHCVAAEMLIATNYTHSHNNIKYCYV